MNDFEVKLISSLVRNLVEAETKEEVDMIYKNIQEQLDVLYKKMLEKVKQ